MQVRMPSIDFASVGPIWAPANPGFGHKYDGASLLLPYLEPFLVKVMRQAQQELAATGKLNDQLEEDIRLFNHQETRHYQLHTAYNDYLKSHYPELEVFEQEIKADFENMLYNWSLADKLAYSAGFETIGPIQTPLWFGLGSEARAGADAQVDELWSWHLAEEFEHRCVAFDVYQALIGKWPLRMKMFFVQTRHLEGFTDRVMLYMMQEDDKAGRFPLARAQALWNNFHRRFRLAALPKVIATFPPWHNPVHAKAPQASLDILEKYSST